MFQDPARMDPPRHPGYPGRLYRQITHADVLDLQRSPGMVAERLTGALLRTLDIADRSWFAIPLRDSEHAGQPEPS